MHSFAFNVSEQCRSFAAALNAKTRLSGEVAKLGPSETVFGTEL